MNTTRQLAHILLCRAIFTVFLIDCWYNTNNYDLNTSMATTTTTVEAFVAPSIHHKVSNHPHERDDHQNSPQQQSQHNHHSLIPSQIFRPNNLKRKPCKVSTTNEFMMLPTSTASGTQYPHVVSQQQLLPHHLTQQQSHSIAASMAISRTPPPLYASVPATTTTTTTAEATNTVSTTDGNLKRGRRRNRTQRKKRAALAEKKSFSATTAVTTTSTSVQPFDSDYATIPMEENIATSNSSVIHQFPTSGNLPDIYWRSIPMEHLRHHPNFVPLPEPTTIQTLRTFDDVKLFRQESWQWDTLHHGRCTTSQAVAALGFLEGKVGEELGVPLSWRRGGTGAFVRLCVTPLRTLDEMNEILIVPKDNNTNSSTSPAAPVQSPKSAKESSIWIQQAESHMKLSDSVRIGFAAQYQYCLTSVQQQDRKKYARKISQNENMSKSIRMMWGNTQEATSLLTAINYFTKLDPGFRLEEVGMCGAGLSLNITSSASINTNHSNESITTISSSLLIGATPDGILRHSDGLIEVLEVKNHCPFFSSSFHSGKGTKNKSGVRKRFTIGSMPFDDKSNGVFAHYVPQLQLEMLCVGPECQSAVMIRQTATAGAVILRMHRDNEWIEEMLYWLHRFQLDYVEPKKPPPKNFFWDSPNLSDRAQYRRFVNKTKEIRNSRVELVARIHNDEIQRMGDHTSLFLD